MTTVPASVDNALPRLRPSGTVTFLFTDLPDSTRLWEKYPEAMRAALNRHDAILRQAIEGNGGYVFKNLGDAFCAVFATASQALAAALAGQRQLHAETWGETGPLYARMALHTGAAQERDGDYFGPPLNRVSRLLTIGHDGQVLISLTTKELLRDNLPAELSLRDLGERRLKDLVRPEHIFQLLTPDLPADFPPLQSLDVLPHNLPVQLTSFIGREREIDDVKKLLATMRLLTLTGTGGTGKTRLSLQVAADLIETYPGGVWFIELAPLSDPALVPQAIISALGIRETNEQPPVETLAEFLQPRCLLLVLDNCEHLMAACAQLAEQLLRACPQLKILVSSRETLGVPGETIFRVPPLALPVAHANTPVNLLSQYEAVRLFIDRAVAVQPHFSVTNENAPAVAEICYRLDGIPLAIELAAARVKMLSAEQIAARLDDRFRLLTGGSRTALPRQQTLRALIDWSYDLLSEPEQVLLQRLAVFAGGWTLAAAKAVCAETTCADTVFDRLTQLVNKSLVMVQELAGETRYSYLETIRQYALEKLQATPAETQVRQRFFDFFLNLAQSTGHDKFYGAEQYAWLDQMETEYDNVREALTWAIRNHPGQALPLGSAVVQFWWARCHLSEGRAWLAQLLALPAAQACPGERARLLIVEGWLARQQGNLETAVTSSEASLALYRAANDQYGSALALRTLGFVAFDRGQWRRAREIFEETLHRFQAIPDSWGIAEAQNIIGYILTSSGEYEEATRWSKAALALRRDIDDKAGMAWSLYNLGDLARFKGDYAHAKQLYLEGLALFRQIKDRWGESETLNGLAYLMLLLDKYDESLRFVQDGLVITRAVGNKVGLGWLLSAQSNVLRERGQYAEAEAAGRESEALFRSIGNKFGLLTALSAVNWVVRQRKDTALVRQLLQEALQLCRETDQPQVVAWWLCDVATWAREQGRLETSAKLLAAARKLAYHQMDRLDRRALDNGMVETRALLSEAAFNTAWEAGEALGMEQALDYAQAELERV